MVRKHCRPATQEIRQRVLECKMRGPMTLPRLVGVPSPDDMAYEPIPEGYKVTFLYHHRPVASCRVVIDQYRKSRGNVVILGSVFSWALEPDDKDSNDVMPLAMSLPVDQFEGLEL